MKHSAVASVVGGRDIEQPEPAGVKEHEDSQPVRWTAETSVNCTGTCQQSSNHVLWWADEVRTATDVL